MSADTTLDGFLGGRLLLAQPARGHRAGTDAALLSACLALPGGGTLFDLGAGVGSAGLAFALANPSADVVLVERDREIAELARRNVQSNHLSARVRVVEVDLAARHEALQPGLAAAVLMNPPFHPPGSTRASPLAYRRGAHEALSDGDEIWIRRAASLLHRGGSLALIHRADALPRLLAALERRFGDVRIVPVLPRSGTAATRILLRARHASRAPLAILPPLILHEDDGRFTPAAAALHDGTGRVDWHDPPR